MSELSEDVNDFLIQAYEDLEIIDVNLIELENNPSDGALVDNLFRCLHSIKGCSGFVKFTLLGNIAHAGENLLGQIREAKVIIDTDVINMLLEVGDVIREILSKIENTGNEGKDDYLAVLDRLRELQKNTKSYPKPNQRMGDILVESGFVTEDDIDEAIDEQDKGDPRHLGEILVDKNHVHPAEVLKALGQQGDRFSVVSKTVRVDVAVLDNLMSLVGELVLTRNQIITQVSKLEITQLLGASERLNVVTNEIQDHIIKTRLQPISKVLTKFPRVIRDMALKCGKQIETKFEGEDTLLDKSVIEAVSDPLNHLVRNAVDHGIEVPSVREAAGKSSSGLIFLRAYHDQGNVYIEIVDDGAGIDYEKIKQKAIDKNLVSEELASSLSEQECLELIFLPGFSMAEKVTNISGRGVGMDVVKTHLEKIGGLVSINSKKGKGTTISLNVPLSVAIVPALIVTTSGERFAIPEVSLVEVVKLVGEQAREAIVNFQNDQTFHYQERDLPVIDLARELMIKHDVGFENIDDPAICSTMVVLQAEDRHFALLVDSVTDIEDIVIKSPDNDSNRMLIFSGSTFTTDGRGALILDAIGLNQVYLLNR